MKTPVPGPPLFTNLQLRHIRSFIAVAEELNFGRAAKRLGLSQPPLSKQIQAMESYLGVQLFERGKSGIRLTESGRATLREAYSVMEQCDRLVRTARRAEVGGAGRLTIVYLPSAFYEILPLLLRKFREKYPKVEIFLKEYDGYESLRGLKNGLIDIAFARISRVQHPLKSLVLRSERCSVALPRDHRYARRDRLSLRDLADEALVVPSSRAFPSYFNNILEAFETARVRPYFAHDALSIASLLTIVASGLAVSFVPRSIEASTVPGVAFVSLEEPIPIVDMSLVWNDALPSPTVQYFVALADTIAEASRGC